MTDGTPVSPRQEALNSILAVRGTLQDPVVPAEAWEKIVDLAWDARSIVSDRRELQREIRAALLERPHGGE